MILKDKNILVTGGNRGIGKAITIKLIEEGAKVLFTYKNNKEEAYSFINEIRNKGRDADVFQMDVTNRSSVRKVISKFKKKFGSMDVLVNNAGINKPSDFDTITDQDWDEILKVNLRGPFICSQESFPILKKKGGGSIINIGSVSGQYGGPRTAHYAASKAGLISLSQVIARFGAKFKIRSNTIAAGLISTDMADEGLKSPIVKKLASNIPLGRLGSAKDIANMVVFLASDDSSYITAQTFNVNGGLYF